MTRRKEQIACSIGGTARAAADEYAGRHDVSLTETVRRALMLLSKVDKGEIRLTSGDGVTRAEVVLL